MPLATAITSVTPSRTLVGKSKDFRRYRVGGADDFIDYIETTTTSEFEYPRLTEAAADAHLLYVEQNPALFRDWKVTKVEDNRFVGSFKIIATQITASTIEANVAPPPTVGGITWSRNNETVSSWPQSVTMSSANPADQIWYRIDAINSSGATVPGTFTNGGSNNVTVSLNTTTLKAGRDGHHKRVVIVAEVRRTQLTGETYIGEQSSRTFTQNAPSVSAITWSINDNLNVTSWPVSVTATTTTAGATVFHRITAFNSQNQEVVGNFVSGGSISANTTTLAAGAGGFHKRIIIEAEARFTLDGIVYTGARSSRNVRQPVPTVSAPTITGSYLFVEDRYQAQNLSEGSFTPGFFNVSADPGSSTEFRVSPATSRRDSTGNEAFRTDTYSDGPFTAGTGGIIPTAGTSYVFYRREGSRRFVCIIVRVEAFAFIVLDGIRYQSQTTTRYARRQFESYIE